MSDLLVTYMEMTAPPAGAPVAPPRADVSVAAERLGVEDYLGLYRSVGEAVQWDSRLRMPRNELEAWLGSDGSHVRVLRQAGKPMGICEFDGVGLPDIELVHFGVAPEAYGKGMGSFLLDGSLLACWAAFSPAV